MKYFDLKSYWAESDLEEDLLCIDLSLSFIAYGNFLKYLQKCFVWSFGAVSTKWLILQNVNVSRNFSGMVHIAFDHFFIE